MKQVFSSFRDPGNSVFTQEDKVFRVFKEHSIKDYIYFMQTGLYQHLVEKKMIVSHKESINELLKAQYPESKGIIEVEKIPFISYPYEWSFSQLKEAALLTLEICKTALKYGMILKDASAYNVQFSKSKPIFIDTGSFAIYNEGQTWDGYKQFCCHFLAPLSLMSHVDIRLNQLLKHNIDGIPLDLTSKLLPLKTWMSPALLIHIHFHAKIQNHYAADTTHFNATKSNKQISKLGLLSIIDNIQSYIQKLNLKKINTEWSEYYSNTNYSDESIQHKVDLITKWTQILKPDTVWDLGGNTGLFSRAASRIAKNVICFDLDPLAIDINYRKNCTSEQKILPLLLDLTNPSPAIGWANHERSNLLERGPVDTVMALAIIHHLSISNNIPLSLIADYFSKLGKNLIIEFIPKSDSQVKKLLLSRKDIFPNYNEEGFRDEFGRYFVFEQEESIKNTERKIFLLKSRNFL